jgi:glutathione S-transferase
MDPTLWHITISHYSEKVRWALDYKSIPYRTRAPIPGAHMPVALWLTRGRHYTFPVIDIDGERIGDSTAIIAALEARHPAPALYPRSAAERERALGLEEWADEELGPNVRRYFFHELLRDPERFGAIAGLAAPRAFRLMGSAGQGCARVMIGQRYQATSDEAAERALARVLAGFDRLEAELGSGDYLVGETFSVADLTAAALLYPLVGPPEADVTIDRRPEPVERLRAQLRGRRGYRWVEEMFRRHRSARPRHGAHPPPGP